MVPAAFLTRAKKISFEKTKSQYTNTQNIETEQLSSFNDEGLCMLPKKSLLVYEPFLHPLNYTTLTQLQSTNTVSLILYSAYCSKLP